MKKIEFGSFVLAPYHEIWIVARFISQDSNGDYWVIFNNTNEPEKVDRIAIVAKKGDEVS